MMRNVGSLPLNGERVHDEQMLNLVEKLAKVKFANRAELEPIWETTELLKRVEAYPEQAYIVQQQLERMIADYRSSHAI